MLTFHAIQDQHLVRSVPMPRRQVMSFGSTSFIRPVEEDKWVEDLLGIAVPTREDMAEIEISSRLYRENDAIYMTASLLQGSQGPAARDKPGYIHPRQRPAVTVRYAEPGVFSAFTKQAQSADLNLRMPTAAFRGSPGSHHDRTADILERVGLMSTASRARCSRTRTEPGGKQGLSEACSADRAQRRPELQGSGKAWSASGGW
jgi:magnesium transporter